MDEAVSAFDNDRPDPELQLIDSEKQNRYPLSSRPITAAHAHISIQAQEHKGRCIKKISGYPRSVQDSDRRLLKRESAADSDASAVHLQHATGNSVRFRLDMRLGKKEKKDDRRLRCW